LLLKYDRKYSKKTSPKFIVFLDHQKYHNLQSLILCNCKLRYFYRNLISLKNVAF
jgi:hypothetical protein